MEITDILGSMARELSVSESQAQSGAHGGLRQPQSQPGAAVDGLE